MYKELEFLQVLGARCAGLDAEAVVSGGNCGVNGDDGRFAFAVFGLQFNVVVVFVACRVFVG